MSEWGSAIGRHVRVTFQTSQRIAGIADMREKKGPPPTKIGINASRNVEPRSRPDIFRFQPCPSRECLQATCLLFAQKRRVVLVNRSVAKWTFYDRRETSETRSTGENRYQEALRKRRNHFERSRIGCGISERRLVRSPVGRDRRFHLQGNQKP